MTAESAQPQPESPETTERPAIPKEVKVVEPEMEVQRVELWGEWFASRSTGQLVIRGVDSVLRIVEKSLVWSTQPSRPAKVSEDASEEKGHVVSNGSNLVVVSRPLSWPLFLPLIGVLGAVRVTVYVVTRIFRKPCDTKDMISWIQDKRRRLRAVKYAGLKNMRKQSEAKSGRTPNGTPCAKKSLPGSITPDHERKRKYCDVEQSDWTDGSDDESVAVKLDKYVENYDSESDPDFVPPSDDETDSADDSVDSEEEALEEFKGYHIVDDKTGEKAPEDVSTAEVQSSPAPTSSPAHSPSVVKVESPQSVSDYGSTNTESPASNGSLASTPLSPKSKFVKFFRRGSKTKQQL